MKRIICATLCALFLTIPVSAEELYPESENVIQATPAALWNELPETLKEFAGNKCRERDVPLDAIIAIAYHESLCNPDIEDSVTHDRGMMQINRINWNWLAKEGIDVNTPEGNVEAAILILSMYLEDYCLETALACYAAGTRGMRRGEGKIAAREILDIMNEIESAPAY